MGVSFVDVPVVVGISVVSVVGVTVLVEVSFGLVIDTALVVVGRVYFIEVDVAGTELVGTSVAVSLVSPVGALFVEISPLEVADGSGVVYSTVVCIDDALVETIDVVLSRPAFVVWVDTGAVVVVWVDTGAVVVVWVDTGAVVVVWVDTGAVVVVWVDTGAVVVVDVAVVVVVHMIFAQVAINL